MQKSEREIEAKFLVLDLKAFEERLASKGGILSMTRTKEINLRFDTDTGALSHDKKVLRIRKDTRHIMTFKSPLDEDNLVRREIEFEVSDPVAARHLLEALGFSVFSQYEKFRTTYDYYNMLITLDELPFGNFVEIEGPDVTTLQVVSAKLGLDWAKRCTISYLELFERLKKKKGLSIPDLNFEVFKAEQILPMDLDLQPADV